MLQEKTYRRVGGIKVLHSDFRLIAATNKDLQLAIQEGRFREDLYYRLNVVSISIPPLREREEDVIYLAEHFLRHFAEKYGKSAPALTNDHKRCLKAHRWPGNVRELKNLMERVIVLQDDSLLYLSSQKRSFDPSAEVSPLNFGPMPTIDELQIAYIKWVLRQTEGKIAGKKGAANILGLKRTTLYSMMKRLGVGGKDPIPNH
jgi:transcriptional regulator with PAS, ATPase and Fis domain